MKNLAFNLSSEGSRKALAHKTVVKLSYGRTTHSAHDNVNSAEPLLQELRDLIVQARRQATAAVNVGLTLLYWRFGDRIRREVLRAERAGYGEQIVVTLSHELVAEFGRGYSEKNLRRMVQFAEAFPAEEIVVTLSRQLSWSHFQALLPLSKPLQRDFYRDESCRELERSHSSRANRLDVERANGPLPQA